MSIACQPDDPPPLPWRPSLAQGDGYYSPDRIDRWIREWDLLESLAETPRTSRHYLTWEHRARQGPCAEDPRFEQRGPRYHADPMSHADIKADIERAWTALRGRWSREYLVVEWRMKGRTLREIDETYRLRHGSAGAIYRDALERMAETLGWRCDRGEADAGEPRQQPFTTTF